MYTILMYSCIFVCIRMYMYMYGYMYMIAYVFAHAYACVGPDAILVYIKVTPIWYYFYIIAF